jgi:putative alpha-1,2-mannosidase
LGCSSENKYIQSATLNGKPWLKSWFFHEEIRNGGKLILKMSKKPNYKWGVGEVDARLSAESIKNVH